MAVGIGESRCEERGNRPRTGPDTSPSPGGAGTATCARRHAFDTGSPPQPYRMRYVFEENMSRILCAIERDSGTNPMHPAFPFTAVARWQRISHANKN
ncbi:hypothetical protein [Azospirillum endophyticum]